MNNQFDVTKQPLNVRAVVEWYENHTDTDTATLVKSLFTPPETPTKRGLVAMVLQGFEAGRIFEREHPDIQPGSGYLPKEEANVPVQSGDERSPQ